MVNSPNSRLISGGIWLYGENTTFGSVVWVVGHISRSDLVRLVFMASVSVYKCIDSILERIDSILIAF